MALVSIKNAEHYFWGEKCDGWHLASGIHVPAGTTHQLSNHQTDDLVFLVVSTPPSHGDRVIA
ncbi:hypothetical protein [Aliarcobacter butzleri]|uniref:hypothetical protein n=1 Tax=Aliarcobacter butzleri TaxID=28197 RepID=UPI00214AD4F9|nr:hypothetical protein [Aliarcobacter butzleri]MCP3649161.1 hypothetical protein [Arcobacter sp. DNRA7]MCR1815335.1 hypothetical protein [Aliarcobacter butzleri]